MVLVELPDMNKSSEPLFVPEDFDFLNVDIDTTEVGFSNFADCLHEGMVEPELD